MLIADASPLISLAQIDELDLLRRLAGRVVVPEYVWTEAVLKKPSTSSAPKIAAATFIDRQVVDVSQAQAIADTYGIGPGESEAIVVAQSASSPTLLLDDELARAAAVALNIPRIGSIGILLLAKARGHIDMVRPRIDGLLAHGTHLSKKLVDEALRRAGE